MRIRRLLPAAALALTALAMAGSASADVATAQSFVEREHGKIKKLVDDNAPADDVRKAIDGMVDYDAFTSRALGAPCPLQVPQCTNHKDKDVSADDYKKIRDLLKKLVARNVQKSLNKTRDYDVVYRGAKDQGDNLSKVRTEAKNKTKPRDPPVQVDYVIACQDPSKCTAIDFVTEGSSMTKNYYDQFHKMLTTPDQGVKYLIMKLEKKVAGPAQANEKSVE